MGYNFLRRWWPYVAICGHDFPHQGSKIQQLPHGKIRLKVSCFRIGQATHWSWGIQKIVRHTWCMQGLSKWLARSIEFLQECTCTSSKFFFLTSQRNTKVTQRQTDAVYESGALNRLEVINWGEWIIRMISCFLTGHWIRSLYGHYAQHFASTDLSTII